MLEFHKQIMIGCQFSVKRFDPFCFELFTPPFGEIVILPKLERPSDFFANLLVFKSLCPLICSFLTLQYFIRFSMNIFSPLFAVIGGFKLESLSNVPRLICGAWSASV